MCLERWPEISMPISFITCIASDARNPPASTPLCTLNQSPPPRAVFLRQMAAARVAGQENEDRGLHAGDEGGRRPALDSLRVTGRPWASTFFHQQQSGSTAFSRRKSRAGLAQTVRTLQRAQLQLQLRGARVGRE